jgi:hypothetical protein
MKKIVVLIALVAFIGVYTAPAFASSESVRIVMTKFDDDPKKKKETKEEKQNKETTTKDCPHQKECKKECTQTCQPSTCDKHKETPEKK